MHRRYCAQLIASQLCNLSPLFTCHAVLIPENWDLCCRLTLDEAELGKVSADVTKDDYIFPMELGEPEQALKTSATRGRTFINITAHSAPSPA